MGEIIIRILILLFTLLFGVQQDVGTPPPLIEGTSPASGEETIRSFTVIESVDALLLESFPVQINLQVNGYQPDGCDFPVQVEQRREGNEVFVDIYRDVPLAVMCPAMLVGYEETIHLDGGFESGTYTIHVNDQTIEVTI
jgi:inhibitor of cysteine peptidase